MLNYVSIAGGVLMPQIGYGVYQFSKGTQESRESQPARIAAADERRRAALIRQRQEGAPGAGGVLKRPNGGHEKNRGRIFK